MLTRKHFDLEVLEDAFDATKVKTYRSARLLIEIGKAAITAAVKTNIITADLKDAIKQIDIYAHEVGNDDSNSTYQNWDDLRHWVVVALQESAQCLTEKFWTVAIDNFRKVETDARSLLDRLHDETEKGMSILQTIFVIGGLAAVGSMIWSYAKGKQTSPQMHVGLLPHPTVTVSAGHEHE